MLQNQKMKKKEYPKISIVLNTLNAQHVLEDCLKFLFGQDYPTKKIEVINSDGGSTDKTLEVIEKYGKRYPGAIKSFHNAKKTKLGRGMGADLASRKATGDMILMMDPDNLLIQKDWLKKMVDILLNNKKIAAVQSRLIVPEEGSIIDKYLGAIGIEDPFAIAYSLNAQIVFNPKKFLFDKKGKFYLYEVDKKNFYYAGDNGFLIWKEVFLENGGYTQDIDNLYRMALAKKKYLIAVPRDIRLYHKSPTDLFGMLKKKGFYLKLYIKNNMKNRDFYWFSLKKNTFWQNLRFVNNVIYNLLIAPALLKSIVMVIKEKKSYWLIHSAALFLITIQYIYSTLYIKITDENVSL